MSTPERVALPMRGLYRLASYMRRYVPYWFTSAVLMAVVGALTALRIMLFKPILDNVLSPVASPDKVLDFLVPGTHVHINLQVLIPSHFHNAWTVVAVALLGSAPIKFAADYMGTVFANKAGFGMITDLRTSLYNSFLSRSSSFYQRYTSGTLISTLINDVDKVQVATSSIMGDFLQQVFTLLFMIGAVITMGGRLAWVLLVFVPVIVTSARRVGKQVRSTTRSGQDKLAEIQSLVQETISGNTIVKTFSTELFELERFRRASDRLLSANMRYVAVQALSSPLMDALGAVAVAGLLFIGRNQILRHGMTAGGFIAFLGAVIALYDPVRKMPVFYNSFQQALGASDEIFKFMDEQEDVHERRGAIQFRSFDDEIAYRGVSFAYGRAAKGREILHNVTLTVKRGEVVAIVGPSGAGKSTLLNLLPRFYDVTAGSITLDGIDVREVTLASLRRQIAKVTQETVLFNDTVRNNIAYGQPHVSMEKIQAAAQAAMAHEFIMKLPHGYDTVIGERGASLSGGERQRIAIARALLKDAPILVLDEATSALDMESEAAVQAALGNLMQGRTVLVIAHRLSTVRRADRIVVMEDGRITESGRHDELMALGGTYHRLYSLQFGGEPQAPPVEQPSLVGGA